MQLIFSIGLHTQYFLQEQDMYLMSNLFNILKYKVQNQSCARNST